MTSNHKVIQKTSKNFQKNDKKIFIKNTEEIFQKSPQLYFYDYVFNANILCSLSYYVILFHFYFFLMFAVDIRPGHCYVVAQSSRGFRRKN